MNEGQSQRAVLILADASLAQQPDVAFRIKARCNVVYEQNMISPLLDRNWRSSNPTDDRLSDIFRLPVGAERNHDSRG